MKEYKQELFAQKTPYLQWLKSQEADLRAQYGQWQNQEALGKQMYTLPFSSCMDSVKKYEEPAADAVYLFVKEGGNLSEYAAAVFAKVFSEAVGAVLVYADEDYRGSLRELYGIEDGIFEDEITRPYCMGGSGAYYRGAPWFKPDFSPDTLSSFFYLGSVFAIRGSRLLEITRKYGEDLSIYELVYRIFMDALDRRQQEGWEEIIHVPKVLYTNDRLNCADPFKASCEPADWKQNAVSDRVSIVIPSKDNAQVLQKCLQTLIQYTNYGNYEVIIVDNGSEPAQKLWITDMIAAFRGENPNLVIHYFYQMMVFNFSAMCNAGAQLADGKYLLFLNDDIEVLDTDEGRQWLDSMLAYARKPHVGAVGAKLYYPSLGNNTCYKIQHVGITNMGIGPAHKLGGMEDTGSLYYGHNTQNYDMLAVTAACMLIRKSVFEEAGGFDETFPVAYNDVELCFRLYRRGYFNVQVNDAVLIHHESLSRGQDTSLEKQSRLLGEKNKLYQKHPVFRAGDPFYSPNLVQWKKDAAYHTGYLYEFDRYAKPILLENDGESGKRKRAVFKKYDFRNFLNASCGVMAKIYDRLTGYRDLMFHVDSVDYGDGAAGACITVEGWSAVRNMDNAGVPRKLWLIYKTRNFDFRSVYEFDIAPKLREDVAEILEEKDNPKGTRNAALSGIQVNIEKSALKPGVYSIGVLCKNKLICDPEKIVNVDRDTERKV